MTYTYRLRLLDLLPGNINMTAFLSYGLNSQFKSHYYIASIVELHNKIAIRR